MEVIFRFSVIIQRQLHLFPADSYLLRLRSVVDTLSVCNTHAKIRLTTRNSETRFSLHIKMEEQAVVQTFTSTSPESACVDFDQLFQLFRRKRLT